jgi:hypothetical protein
MNDQWCIQAPFYAVFFPLLEQLAPAQRTPRRSASIAPYVVCRGGSAVVDGSLTNDRSDNNL